MSGIPNSSPIRNAVVIGAGVAGLGAAIRLKELGVPSVVVLEAEKTPGGLARSLRYDGLSSDMGPHRLYTEIPEIERFYNDLLAERMYVVKRKSRMYLDGKFINFPLKFGDMLRGPGPLRLLKFAASMAKSKVQNIAGRGGGDSFQTVMRDAFGTALYDYIPGPYAAKVWKTDPAELDAHAARVRVSAGSLAKLIRRAFIESDVKDPVALSEFRYIKGGAESLVRHLTDKVEELGGTIETGTNVAEFESANGKITGVRTGGDSNSNYRTIPADIVISTMPLPSLATRLIHAKLIPAEIFETANKLRFLDTIFVTLIVRRKVISGDNWLYFPGNEIFNRAYESKSNDPGMGTSDQSALCVEITCRRDADWWKTPDAKLIERVKREMIATKLFAAEEIDRVYVNRIQNTYPLYLKGYQSVLHKVISSFAPIGNILTTGRQGLFNFNNMDHSIFMGMKAAETALSSSNPAQTWIEASEAFQNFRIVD